jgi:hypothetical protein
LPSRVRGIEPTGSFAHWAGAVDAKISKPAAAAAIEFIETSGE